MPGWVHHKLDSDRLDYQRQYGMLSGAVKQLKALWDWFWFNDLAREIEEDAAREEEDLAALGVELPKPYRPGRTIL